MYMEMYTQSIHKQCASTEREREREYNSLRVQSSIINSAEGLHGV